MIASHNMISRVLRVVAVWVVAGAARAVAAGSATTRVDVGNSGVTFEPSFVRASVGDVIEFHYWPMNHSVAQGDFSTPCAVGPLTGGFYSGFIPSGSGEATQVFRLQINDTNPIYFYCSTPKHCQAGMVGSINAPNASVFETYMSNAQMTNISETPAVVQGGILAANVDGSSVSSSSSTSTATTTATASPSPSKNAAGMGISYVRETMALGILAAVLQWVL